MKEMVEFIPTRQSLLSRLKNWDDQESWKVFFDTYWRLIYRSATKAGLSEAEAQDVVQETVISVMKSMPGFKYDTKNGSFKGWLLRLTKWRIIDQFRKRQRGIAYRRENMDAEPEATPEADVLEAALDPASSSLEVAWDVEWEANLIEAAMDRVKLKVDEKQYQIYDLYVIKKISVLKVSKMLGVNPGFVYLAKHRVGKLLRVEINDLKTKLI